MLFLGAAGVLAIQVAVLWGLYSSAQRAELWRLIVRRWRRPPPPPVAPAPPPPQPRDLAPLFGNIPLVASETEPDLTEADEFPALVSVVTRFEELNWRLIIFDETVGSNAEWPIRTFNDFPLTFRGSADQLQRHARKRLRPRYPVIIDWDGYWHGASVQLERNPNLRLPLLEAYLGLEPELRPVIISRIRRPNMPLEGVLQCLRYGFTDYRFPLDATSPYTSDALIYLLDSLTGPADLWLWFSVARMRATVIAVNQETEALRTRLQEEAEQNAAIQHENRFAALWKLRDAPRVENSGQPPEPADSGGAAQ